MLNERAGQRTRRTSSAPSEAGALQEVQDIENEQHGTPAFHK